MKDTRTDKELIWVLEANEKTIHHAISRIELYSNEIKTAVKAIIWIYGIVLPKTAK